MIVCQRGAVAKVLGTTKSSGVIVVQVCVVVVLVCVVVVLVSVVKLELVVCAHFKNMCKVGFIYI